MERGRKSSLVLDGQNDLDVAIGAVGLNDRPWGVAPEHQELKADLIGVGRYVEGPRRFPRLVVGQPTGRRPPDAFGITPALADLHLEAVGFGLELVIANAKHQLDGPARSGVRRHALDGAVGSEDVEFGELLAG